MTNVQIENIYRAGLATGNHASALRAVWNAGWYEKAGITPTASSADQSIQPSAPVAVVTGKKR
jgi:hypothetical protein